MRLDLDEACGPKVGHLKFEVHRLAKPKSLSTTWFVQTQISNFQAFKHSKFHTFKLVRLSKFEKWGRCWIPTLSEPRKLESLKPGDSKIRNVCELDCLESGLLRDHKTPRFSKLLEPWNYNVTNFKGRQYCCSPLPSGFWRSSHPIMSSISANILRFPWIYWRGRGFELDL